LTYVEKQLFIEDTIAPVLRLSGKVKLGRKNRPLGRLDPYVEMAGSPWIKTRHNSLKKVTPGVLGILVTAQPVTGVVVHSVSIGLPEVHKRAADGMTPAVSHVAPEENSCTFHAGLYQGSAFG
jgi:hypothetical protein